MADRLTIQKLNKALDQVIVKEIMEWPGWKPEGDQKLVDYSWPLGKGPGEKRFNMNPNQIEDFVDKISIEVCNRLSIKQIDSAASIDFGKLKLLIDVANGLNRAIVIQEQI
jgi:hypothetical protein